MILLMFLKVNKYLFILFIIFYYIGIGLIKKASKNKILVESNFYDLYFNIDKNINELNEENIKEKKNQLKNINKEINDVSYLTKIVNEKLLIYQNNNDINNKKIINIPYKDFFILNNNNDINKNTSGFIALKSENGIKIELTQMKVKNISEQKNSDNNNEINQYNEEYLNLPSLSNKLYISSNNHSLINLIKIDLKSNKNKKEKEKEEINNINNYNSQKENENFLNYKNIDYNNINNINIINKSDINYSPFKNYNYSFDNKNKKDSLISDFSFCGNLFNTELNNLFNNEIL